MNDELCITFQRDNLSESRFTEFKDELKQPNWKSVLSSQSFKLQELQFRHFSI
jgi:hypothetical protein